MITTQTVAESRRRASRTPSAAGSLHSHVARPSTEEEQIAALVASGSVTSLSLWRVVGAQPYNSDVVFEAQAAIIAEKNLVVATKEAAAARDKVELEVATLAASSRRPPEGDSKLGFKDL